MLPMVLARQESCQDRAPQQVRIPEIRFNDSGRVILPQLDLDMIEYLGIPLVPYTVLQVLQESNRDGLIPHWDLLAGYYGHDFSTDSPELKEYAGMEGASGSVVRRRIKKGMLAAFDILPDETKLLFTPEEIKQLMALKYKYAQVYLDRQRDAVGQESFRARQAELRKHEDQDCPRRQKIRETNARLADNEAFQQRRRESIKTALAQAETHRKISTALHNEWNYGIRSRENLIAFNKSAEMRGKRKRQWDVEAMHRRKREIADSGLSISPSRYRKMARGIKDIDKLDKLLWQSVCNRPDILEKVFAHAGLSEEEKRKITEYFTAVEAVSRPEPSLFERFSRGVALYG